MDQSIENLLLNIFQCDKEINGELTFISQMSIITIKSLLPDRDKIGNRIDYKRFYEELKLWSYYRRGDNSSLLNCIGKIDSNVYFLEKDSSIFARIIPIVLSNSDFQLIESEVIKNILFTTGNIESLFEGIILAKITYLLRAREEDILYRLRDYIIGFSQTDYMNNFQQYYSVPVIDYPGNFKIIFEKEKINALNILHGINTNKFLVLQEVTNILQGRNYSTLLGKAIFDFINNTEVKYDLPRFYINLKDYLGKLKKSRIDPKSLEIKEYILPDVFSFNENEFFYHSLLKQAKVIKKEARNSFLTSLIQTKTGMYLFKKRLD